MTRRRNTTTLWAAALAVSLGAMVIVAGCSSNAPQQASSVEMTPGAGGSGGGVLYASQEPIGAQLVRVVPPLKNQRFSTLLDFESDPDRVFVNAKPIAQLTYDRAHTGQRSLRVEPGTEHISIKLASVLGGRPFPGEWTLLGAFLYCQQPIDVLVSVENAGFVVPPRKVTLSSNTWTNALVDISAAPHPGSSAAAAPNAVLVIGLPPRSPAVWCDDVMLIDNRQPLVLAGEGGASVQSVETPAGPTTAPVASFHSPWSLERRGLSYVASADGKFNISLLTSEASAGGWKLEEANELRARFNSEGTDARALTVYSDGRSYWDGQYRPISAVARNSIFAEEHASPAEVVVPEELGHLNRNTPGDANNDGYNEQRGAYQIMATGARLEVTLTPRSRALVRPVLEVRGLSAGKVLVTTEGRLIDRTVRLEDGTLLIEIPTVLER